MGLIAPAWYLGPQKSAMGETAWQMLLADSNILSGNLSERWREPASLTFILQLSGEYADDETKARIWEVVDDIIEPAWDLERGEFTLGLGLNEAHPRGQLNARMMAGWVCTPGAWQKIFNAPNLQKFDEPTIVGVDFPSVALSAANWDGEAMHLAAQGQNAGLAGATTTVTMTNIPDTNNWYLYLQDGTRTALNTSNNDIDITLSLDNVPVVVRQV